MKYIEKFGWGYILTRKSDQLIFKTKDRKETLVVEGNTILTITGAGYVDTRIFRDPVQNTRKVRLSLKKGGKSECVSIFSSEIMRLRHKQAQIYHNKEKRFEMAKKFVFAGIQNKIALLNHFANVTRDREIFRDDIVKLQREKETLVQMRINSKKSAGANINELMGVEGTAARYYFQALAKIIPSEFNFKGRTKHPPTDELNAALSYGYVIMANTITDFLSQAGFNPKIGFLHEFGRGRDSLALDILEEFRQPIVDMAVIPLAIKKILNPKTCFTSSGGRFLLNKIGKRHLSKALNLSLIKRRRDILNQIDALAQALLKDKPYDPFLMELEGENNEW